MMKKVLDSQKKSQADRVGSHPDTRSSPRLDAENSIFEVSKAANDYVNETMDIDLNAVCLPTTLRLSEGKKPDEAVDTSTDNHLLVQSFASPRKTSTTTLGDRIESNADTAATLASTHRTDTPSSYLTDTSRNQNSFKAILNDHDDDKMVPFARVPTQAVTEAPSDEMAWAKSREELPHCASRDLNTEKSVEDLRLLASSRPKSASTAYEQRVRQKMNATPSTSAAQSNLHSLETRLRKKSLGVADTSASKPSPAEAPRRVPPSLQSLENCLARKQRTVENDDNKAKPTLIKSLRSSNHAAARSLQALEDRIGCKAQEGTAGLSASAARASFENLEESILTKVDGESVTHVAVGASARPVESVARAPDRMADRIRAKEARTAPSTTTPPVNEGYSSVVATFGGSSTDTAPPVLPGAFAVGGMRCRVDSVDSSDEDPQSTTTPNTIIDAQVQVASTFRAEAHVDAELLDIVEVEGLVIADEEEEVDPKTLRKLRGLQLGILSFSLCAVIMVVLSTTALSSTSASTGGSSTPTLQGWALVGATIQKDSDESQLRLGDAAVMSSDGSRVLVTAPGEDSVDGAADFGSVNVFLDSGSHEGVDWVPLSTIQGRSSSSTLRSALAASKSGHKALVGYPFAGNGTAQFLSEGSQGEWSVLASIESDVGGTMTGFAVDMTESGLFAAIGAPAESFGDCAQCGSVTVYSLASSSPQRMGAVIRGEDSEALFGWSVTVASNDGNARVAVGSPGFDGDRGHVRILELVDGEWATIGERFSVGNGMDRFGEAVALSHDGKTLAVGARGVLDPGYVAIYREVNGVWTRDDQLFHGNDMGEGFGTSVALAGDALAIGAPNNQVFGVDGGRVQVWQYDSATRRWEKQGSDIWGDARQRFGTAVAVSDDGTRVLGGAPLTSLDGSRYEVGGVKVYERTNK